MIQHIHLVTNQHKIEFALEVDPSEPSDAWLLHHMHKRVCYEPEVTHIMMRVIRPGDTVVDVGANLGFFTSLMGSLVGPTGHVYAFEPGRNTLPKLRESLVFNAMSQVHLIEQPVWCRQEPVDFWINSDNAGSNAVWDVGKWRDNTNSAANPQKVALQATTLDAQNLKDVRLIKIDTEGAEQRVLEGADKLLREHYPPYVVAELNPFGLDQLGCSTESLRQYMRQQGYELFLPHHEGIFPALIPPTTQIAYQNGCVVTNGLFSTMEQISKAWPKAPFEYPQ